MGNSAQRGVEQVNTGISGALQAPLEDLNLIKAEIPPVLLAAADAPYSTLNLNRCSAIAEVIGHLDEALGPDLDADEAKASASASDKAADVAADATLDAVRDTVTDFIPARSWVRRLSGAHQHSQMVRTAVQTGLQRRAFLKGVGQQMNCAPPAAPAEYVPR